MFPVRLSHILLAPNPPDFFFWSRNSAILYNKFTTHQSIDCHQFPSQLDDYIISFIPDASLLGVYAFQQLSLLLQPRSLTLIEKMTRNFETMALKSSHYPNHPRRYPTPNHPSPNHPSDKQLQDKSEA